MRHWGFIEIAGFSRFYLHVFILDRLSLSLLSRLLLILLLYVVNDWWIFIDYWGYSPVTVFHRWSGSSQGFCLILLELSLLLVLLGLLDYLNEVALHLLHAVGTYLHPRMGSYFGDWGSLSRVITKQLLEQVSAIGWQVSTLNFIPVVLVILLAKEVIKELLLASFLKREDPPNEDEEVDSGREQVGLPSIICLALLNFRGHVCEGTSVWL